MLIRPILPIFGDHVNPLPGSVFMHSYGGTKIKAKVQSQQGENEASAYGITDMGTRQILAANLRALMDASPHWRSTLTVEKATALRGAKVGKSTIDRALKSETALTLDNVEALAKLFGLDAWQLLVPAMRPDNPPLLRSVGEAEDKLYKNLGRLVDEIANLKR